MERTHRLFALVAAAMLVTSAFGIGAVAGASAANTGGNTGLSVGVTQDDGVTVTVTDNGSYEGTGSYTTDNGTVSLASPEENVTVTVTAAYDNDTASTTVDLVAANESDENETDDNESDAFGERVSEYVSGVLTDGSIDRPGVVISQWVVENNPGNADPPAFDDNRTRGPPEDRGPDANETDDDTNETDDDANETDGNESERGPPEDAGPDDDKERGPPEDRGNDADDEEEEDSEEEAETEEDDADEDDADDDTDDEDGEDEDDDGGPPDDRGNGNGR